MLTVIISNQVKSVDNKSINNLNESRPRFELNLKGNIFIIIIEKLRIIIINYNMNHHNIIIN